MSMLSDLPIEITCPRCTTPFTVLVRQIEAEEDIACPQCLESYGTQRVRQRLEPTRRRIEHFADKLKDLNNRH